MKLLCLFLIASCSSYFPPIRGQYTLTSEKHFMYSNMYVNPSNLEQQNDKIVIHYDVIVKNIDNKSHQVDLQKSQIRILEKTYPMNCYRYKKHGQTFSMAAGEQTRIFCQATLTKANFKRSDYQSILEIPLDQDIAKFEYLLRAEDFQ